MPRKSKISTAAPYIIYVVPGIRTGGEGGRSTLLPVFSAIEPTENGFRSTTNPDSRLSISVIKSKGGKSTVPIRHGITVTVSVYWLPLPLRTRFRTEQISSIDDSGDFSN